MTPGPPSAEHATDCAAFRAALRRQALAARLALTAAEHAACSARIEAHLLGELLARPAQTIAWCAPIRAEFDARPLVERLLRKGWHAAMPVVEAPDRPMRFRAWSPDCAMTSDRHGIPVPSAATFALPDVVLLPLLAFDAQGFRLGYGGGYFDRTLAALKPRPLAIGVGFETGRADSVQPQCHDIRADMLVTEAGVWRLA